MTAKRVDMHRLIELVRLHRLGQSARDASRMLRMGRNSVRRYLAALAKEGLLDGAPDALPDLEALKAAVEGHAPRTPAPQRMRSTRRTYRRTAA